MSQHSTAFHRLDQLRQRNPKVRLPLVLFYQASSGLHYWTAFAQNGRIIGASSQGFASRWNAKRNHDVLKWTWFGAPYTI